MTWEGVRKKEKKKGTKSKTFFSLQGLAQPQPLGPSPGRSPRARWGLGNQARGPGAEASPGSLGQAFWVWGGGERDQGF